MKSTLIVALLLVATICFAQAKKDTTASKPNTGRQRNRAIGKVIHDSNKNCSTLIQIVDKEKKDTTYYIPMSAGIDTLVGSTISFNYGRLMIRQPLGCTGTPVRIWNVQKVEAPSKKHHRVKM